MPSVVHFAYLDSVGGSGRSAYRIHRGLHDHGFDSRMLVGRKFSSDSDVEVLGSRPAHLGFLLDRAGRILSDLTGLQDILIPSSPWLYRHPWVRRADVLQFFNTWGGFVSFTALARLSRDRPVVWRLSDQWLFTGHCVYTYDCDRWLTGCGQCPQVRGERWLPFDTSALLWRLKDRVYERANLVIVAPSRWILDQARRSPLIGRFPVHHIPNGVDTSVFRPMRAEARAALGIDPGARVVVFAAHELGKGRKGGHLLRAALEALPDVPGATLLLLGEGSEKLPTLPGWQVARIGYTDDEAQLARVFAAADVMAAPSVADNLPNTVIESLACGTPVLAFGVGGVGEVVRHMETGYLARPLDLADLAAGLRMLLQDDELRARLGSRCREVALAEYAQELELERFMALYADLAHGPKAGSSRAQVIESPNERTGLA